MRHNEATQTDETDLQKLVTDLCPLRLSVQLDAPGSHPSKPHSLELSAMSDLAASMKAAGLVRVFSTAMKLPLQEEEA